MAKHFKGSRAIIFWCYFMFGMERDTQAEDEEAQQTTTFRILKDRFTGNATGKTLLLGFDRVTGRLYEKDDLNPFKDETKSNVERDF